MKAQWLIVNSHGMFVDIAQCTVPSPTISNRSRPFGSWSTEARNQNTFHIISCTRQNNDEQRDFVLRDSCGWEWHLSFNTVFKLYVKPNNKKNKEDANINIATERFLFSLGSNCTSLCKVVVVQSIKRVVVLRPKLFHKIPISSCLHCNLQHEYTTS